MVNNPETGKAKGQRDQALSDFTVLLTVPGLQDRGGVASFYNGVLPHFPDGKVIPLEIGRSRNSGGLFHPLADQIRFYRMMKKVKPALVHLNPSLTQKSFFRDGIFAWQAKKMGCPVLVFWRGWQKEFEPVIAGKYSGFFKKTFGRVDAFIVLASEFEEILRNWGVKAPIYRGTTCVEESFLTDIDVRNKFADFNEVSPRKILFLARLKRSKGAFETLQAVKILLERKLPVQLTIAGDGAILGELKEVASHLGLTSAQVRFVGDVRGADKVRALITHHIYCLPTYFAEGMPNSVLEAMASGMPVVTRPVGGLADFFEDGKMGCLVHGKSPQEVAGCLEKIITDPKKMAEMGNYNASYAREHFMASVVAKQLLEIYEKMIDDKKWQNDTP